MQKYKIREYVEIFFGKMWKYFSGKCDEYFRENVRKNYFRYFIAWNNCRVPSV